MSKTWEGEWGKGGFELSVIFLLGRIRLWRRISDFDIR